MGLLRYLPEGQRCRGLSPSIRLNLLKLAQDLANIGGEAEFRTAVGRAYYSLFLLAREKTGAYPAKKDDSAHALVINAVRKRQGFAVGNDLYRLKQLRIAADYNLLPDDALRDWAQNWTTARSLVLRLLPQLQAL